MTNIEKLVEAVKEHGGLDNQELRDAANHGADAGWGGFTYYSDTVAFFDKYEGLIEEIAADDMDNQGIESLPEFVGTFRCAPDIHNITQFKNALAWYALETAGRYVDDNYRKYDREESEESNENI